MTLHFNGVGSHPRVFEALSSMLSRNALNPADVSMVRTVCQLLINILELFKLLIMLVVPLLH